MRGLRIIEIRRARALRRDAPTAGTRAAHRARLQESRSDRSGEPRTQETSGSLIQRRGAAGDIFKHIDDDEISHITETDAGFAPTPQNAIGFFAAAVHRDMRLVGGRDILFGKLKVLIRDHLFERPVDLDDLNVLRNLSEPEVSASLTRIFKKAINDLTVVDRGTTRVQDRIKMSRARPMVVTQQPDMRPKKSIFNRVVGDRSELELNFARFLDACTDIVSFVKNTRETNFSVE